MPPAIAAVASIAASIGITFLEVSAIVKAVLTIAVALATTLLAKKPKTNKINQGHELRTKFDPNYPREVLVGKIATAGSCHFAYTTTNSSKKPNRYLYRVIQISDRPIHSLLKIMEGVNEVTFVGDVTTGWRASNQHLNKDGAACMWVRVYLGSDSPTADATLVSETGGEWTNNHKGTGISYAIVKLDYDPEAFPGGEPELVFVVEGAHLYDDRKDSTVSGGSGSHRLNNYSTWEYSATTSIIIAQFLRGFYTNGVPIVGVQADERDMTASMLFSAHNTCEADVEIEPGGVFENRYESGMIIKADESASDVLVDLQAAMDGKIFDRGGYITILPGADRTPVLDLTDDDIDWTAEKSWQPKANLEQMVNHITANFIDADQNFQERELPIQVNTAWEVDDGGERFTQFYSFRAVNKWTQGQRIVKRIHLASRQSGTVAFIGGIWLLEMEQGDWFTLTSPRWGMTDKYFEIQEIDLTTDVRVMIVAREVDPDNDIWDYSVDEVARTDSTWTPPSYSLPVPLIEVNAITVIGPDGHESFTIEMGLSDDPALYGSIVKYLEFQYWYGSTPTGGDNGVGVPIIPVEQGHTSITGVAAGTEYWVRARLRDSSRYGNWTSWISATTDTTTGMLFTWARLVPESKALPANDAGTVTSYTDATTDLEVTTPAGTDISSYFTLSTAPSGNPDGLTVSYVGQTVSVTAGFPTAKTVTSLVVRATGTGPYTGDVYDRVFILIKNTINTQIDAYLSPNSFCNVPTDTTDTILAWSPAQPVFIAKLRSDGSDISNQFTLSVPVGGNPDGLTYTIYNAENPRRVEITGGLTAAENPGTLVIQATGSGAYAGVIFNRVYTINMDYSGVAVADILSANDNNNLTPDATGSITSITQYASYPDGNVSYRGTFTFAYNTSPQHKNNVDGFAYGVWAADTNAAHTMLGPNTAGEDWHVQYMPMGSANYTINFFNNKNPTKWYIIAVAPFRLVNPGTNSQRYVIGPIVQSAIFQPSATQAITGTTVTVGGQTATNVGSGTGRALTVINANNNIVGTTKINGDSGRLASDVDTASGRALAAITSGNLIAGNAANTASLQGETVTHMFAGATSTTEIDLDGANYGTYVSVASSSFTVQESGADVLFLGIVSVRFGISATDSNLQCTATVRCRLGAGTSNTFEVTQTVYAAGRHTTVPMIISHLFEGASAGSNTFYLEVKADDPGGSGEYVETRGVRAVQIMELKR